MILEQSSRVPRKVLVRGAKQLVTLRGEHRPRQGQEMASLHIINDGAMLIVDGIIREVGASRRVERLAEARDADEVDATGRVVMPGFVDCVTRPLHPVASAGAFDERCRQGQGTSACDGLNSSASLKSYSSQRLESEARRCISHFLEQGTLTMAASPGWDGDARTTIKALRVLQELSAGAMRVIPIAALGPEAGPELAERVWHAKLSALASIDSRFSNVRQLVADTRKLGFALRILGDPRLAAECGAKMWLGTAEDDEAGAVAMLLDSGVVCTSYPAVDWLRGNAPPPLRARVDAGLAVALASGYGVDGSAASNLATVMSLACLQSRLTPAEALTAVTINAAFAMNIAHKVGSLSPGKSADALLLDVGDYREIAMQAGSNLIRTVMVRGQYAKARTGARMPVASETRRGPSPADLRSRAS